MKVYLATLVTIATLVTGSGCAEADGAKAVDAYSVLDKGATKLQEDFNRAKGSVRLLFVVDPICPGCLRGLDDVNRDLLATSNDPHLQTFVVHVPVLGAEAKDIAPAARLLDNQNVHHYWNPSGSFGRELAAAVGLKQDDKLVYAWDVWLVYGPDVTWEGQGPPKPALLMHQLRALQGSTEFPRLDSRAFAQVVRKQLAMKPSQPTS
jgi:hypothetical protein